MSDHRPSPARRGQHQEGSRAGHAGFTLECGDAGQILRPSGDWTASNLGDAPIRLMTAISSEHLAFDARDLGRIDTAGAVALMRAMEGHGEVAVDTGDRRDLQRLGDLVRPVLGSSRPTSTPEAGTLLHAFERVGRGVTAVAGTVYRNQVFAGRLVVAVGRTIVRPSRLRTIPLVATMEQAGLAALPIVVVMTFFIGAVLALVGSNMLTTLGVTVYAVELVGIGILREFGAVIAAILFAGRSASAFAAQLGAMQMNQEIDALDVMGVDRFDALVVPRFLAALLMLPLMTVVADVGGLAGGMLVAWTMMDIDPRFFLDRLVSQVGAHHFWIGMAKAPFFAAVVAVTGCRHGLETDGDVESLGRRVTAAVVESIFLIIMFDAVFAVLFRQLDR